MDCVEDRTLRAVRVGMLGRGLSLGPTTSPPYENPQGRDLLAHPALWKMGHLTLGSGRAAAIIRAGVMGVTVMRTMSVLRVPPDVRSLTPKR